MRPRKKIGKLLRSWLHWPSPYALAAQDLRDVAQRLREVVEEQREELTKSAWQAAVGHAANEYEALIETLRKAGVTDPSEYGRLVQDRQRLYSELTRLDSMQEERDRLVEQSRSLLENVTEARRAVSHARDRFLEETLAHNEFVLIRSLDYGDDPRAIERSLRETLEAPDHFEGDILVMEEDRAVKGCVAELLNDLPENSAQRSSEMENRIQRTKHRIHDAGTGNGGFGGHFNNHLEAKYNKSPEVFDKVQTWFPEDGLLVEYSRRGDGTNFHPIAQASAGQRSAAMLAFLLAHGEEPLVLDQPEDDLDNHLIYDLVVRQIRQNKLRRQIIVVTHNPQHRRERGCGDAACPRLSGRPVHRRAVGVVAGGSDARGSLPNSGGWARGVRTPLSAFGAGAVSCLTAERSCWTRFGWERTHSWNTRRCGLPASGLPNLAVTPLPTSSPRLPTAAGVSS